MQKSGRENNETFFFACKKNLRKKEGRNKVINLAFAKATNNSGLKIRKKKIRKSQFLRKSRNLCHQG